MHKSFHEATQDLPSLSPEELLEYTQRLIRMFGSFAEAVDECVEPPTVKKVVGRWRDLMGDRDE